MKNQLTRTLSKNQIMTTLEIESLIIETTFLIAISLSVICIVIGILYMRTFRKKKDNKDHLNYLLEM